MSEGGPPDLALMVVGRTTLAQVLDRLVPGRGAPVQVALRLLGEVVAFLDREGSAAPDGEPPRPERIRIDFGDGTSLRWIDDPLPPKEPPAARADGYASPEEAAGQPPDPRSSMFTLGVILFESLSGSRLYDGEPHEVRARILNEPPPDAGEVRLDCPPEVVELLFELLCKDPAGRPSSMADLRQRVHALVEERAGWEGASPLDEFLRGLDVSDDATAAIALPPDVSEEAPTAKAASPEASDEVPTTRAAPSSDVSEDTTTDIALPLIPATAPRIEERVAPPEGRPAEERPARLPRPAGKKRGRLRQDILLITMLLVLSAVVGWLARVILP